MRWLTWALALALLAAAVALLLQINAGNVAFFIPPYRLDVSLNVVLLALLVLLAVTYWGARALQKIADFPERVRCTGLGARKSEGSRRWSRPCAACSKGASRGPRRLRVLRSLQPRRRGWRR